MLIVATICCRHLLATCGKKVLAQFLSTTTVVVLVDSHSGQIKWYSHVACYPKLVLRDVFLCIWGPQNTSHKNCRASSF